MRSKCGGLGLRHHQGLATVQTVAAGLKSNPDQAGGALRHRLWHPCAPGIQSFFDLPLITGPGRSRAGSTR